MNKKWIASLACVCLLASSFTAAVAEGMKPGTSPLWDFMNEPDAGVISPQISMQDMTHKDMRNCLYINRKGRCQHYVHCRDRHCQTESRSHHHR